MHSQSISSDPLHPWVAAKTGGTISCAQCTCVAGIGEACSHIAAVLFAAEANTKRIQGISCTSNPCSWSAPRSKIVEYAPISEIDFTTPQKKRKMIECGPHASRAKSIPLFQWIHQQIWNWKHFLKHCQGVVSSLLFFQSYPSTVRSTFLVLNRVFYLNHLLAFSIQTC